MRKILFILFVIISNSLFSQNNQASPPPTDTTEGNVFEKVDVEATFPGGETAWRKYLEKNLNPNVPVENGAPVGIYTVIVQFIVDKTGAISDIKTLTNFGYGMEQEVLRIMKNSQSLL